MASKLENPKSEATTTAYKARLEITSQDKAFLDRMIEFFTTQLTTGLAQLDYLGYQKAICQAEQDLALAIGRTDYHAYWHEMERRINWGRVRCLMANGELEEEISKLKKERGDIDERARAIRESLSTLITIEGPADGGTKL